MWRELSAGALGAVGADIYTEDEVRHARVSVFRVPVDFNALLFQIGEPDPFAGRGPRPQTARQRFAQLLADETITEEWDPDQDRIPGPPIIPCDHMAGQIRACKPTSLLTITGEG